MCLRILAGALPRLQSFLGLRLVEGVGLRNQGLLFRAWGFGSRV